MGVDTRIGFILCSEWRCKDEKIYLYAYDLTFNTGCMQKNATPLFLHISACVNDTILCFILLCILHTENLLSYKWFGYWMIWFTIDLSYLLNTNYVWGVLNLYEQNSFIWQISICFFFSCRATLCLVLSVCPSVCPKFLSQILSKFLNEDLQLLLDSGLFLCFSLWFSSNFSSIFGFEKRVCK